MSNIVCVFWLVLAIPFMIWCELFREAFIMCVVRCQTAKEVPTLPLKENVLTAESVGKLSTAVNHASYPTHPRSRSLITYSACQNNVPPLSACPVWAKSTPLRRRGQRSQNSTPLRSLLDGGPDLPNCHNHRKLSRIAQS